MQLPIWQEFPMPQSCMQSLSTRVNCTGLDQLRGYKPRTLSSLQTAPQRMPMHSSLRALPSPICTWQCCRQQSLQKVWPHSIRVHCARGTLQKQQPHSTSALPAHPPTTTHTSDAVTPHQFAWKHAYRDAHQGLAAASTGPADPLTAACPHCQSFITHACTGQPQLMQQRWS